MEEDRRTNYRLLHFGGSRQMAVHTRSSYFSNYSGPTPADVDTIYVRSIPPSIL